MDQQNRNRDGQKKRPFAGNKGGAPRGKGPYVKGPRGPRPPMARPQPTARDAALQAFRYVVRENAYASQALDRELGKVNLSDEDRRLAAGIFFFTLENRLRIERVLMRFMKARPVPEVMEILDVAAAQILFMDRIPDHAAVDEAVKQTRKARQETMTGMVNGVLRNLIRARDAGELTYPDREEAPIEYISEKYSVAMPLAKRLIDAYGMDTAEQIAAWTPDRRSAVIRPNRLRMSDADFEAWMTQQKLDWQRCVVPGAYRVTGAGKIAAGEGYRGGMFSIQGESSMLAAYAVEAKPGMQVLDACAAPGGKTCLMAEMMKGAGRVYAWDLHEHRVELIRAAAKRLELDNVRTQMRDASKRVDSMLGSMDAVLVDAPCSGIGVMGDKPDIKYRLNSDKISELIPVQSAILETCAEYVRPGGLLVYSTCTILPEENCGQVERFLKEHPEFEPDTNAKWLPEELRDRLENGMLQLLPGRDGVEGFFIARLRRKADSVER